MSFVIHEKARPEIEIIPLKVICHFYVIWKFSKWLKFGLKLCTNVWILMLKALYFILSYSLGNMAVLVQFFSWFWQNLVGVYRPTFFQKRFLPFRSILETYWIKKKLKRKVFPICEQKIFWAMSSSGGARAPVLFMVKNPSY